MTEPWVFVEQKRSQLQEQAGRANLAYLSIWNNRIERDTRRSMGDAP